MADKTVLGFVAALVVLFAQFAVSLVLVEPYPSIRYPSFAAVYDTTEYIEFSRTEVAITGGDGSSRMVKAEDLMSGVPQSAIPSALVTIARRLGGGSEVFTMRLGGFLYEIKKTPHVSDEEREEFLRWLAERARELDVGADAVSIRFYSTRIYLDGPSPREESTLLDTVEIELPPAGDL